ncbi:hypothetical protein CNYM01_01236 [Colletotrichum nymphaeae SA-01]|uniref:Uncharacterized protein n=1 Tax=Colletotrichum nymphaeae SA-01 TaxID=1460502 RepID=A0A135UMP9_9PEZI|nr:hypothetical protein CNYM01_01236 [Colletotrichum nymphaeae SA-01]
MSEDSHTLNHSRNSMRRLPPDDVASWARGAWLPHSSCCPTAPGPAIWVSTRLCHHSFVGFSSTRVQRCKSTHQSVIPQLTRTYSVHGEQVPFHPAGFPRSRARADYPSHHFIPRVYLIDCASQPGRKPDAVTITRWIEHTHIVSRYGTSQPYGGGDSGTGVEKARDRVSIAR